VEATRKFVGKGLASFLQKPFTVGKLLAAVKGALEQNTNGGSAHGVS
jgi:FixJ family two-component response regulator